MNILRIFFLTIFFYIWANACADSFWDDDNQFVFLDKREYQFFNITQNLNSSRIYNDIVYYDYNERVKKENLEEWQHEYSSFSKKQLEKFLYKKKDLEALEDEELRDYINFLKKQDYYVKRNYFYYYYKKKNKKREKPESLIDYALDKVDTIKSRYLKLRYFYLALRLAHYEKKNPLIIYNDYKYLLNDDTKTIVKDWIQGLYAGALIKNKQTARGVYEFTKLFSPLRINWHLSYYNFKYIKTNEQWEELQTLAKNSDEKIKFYTLRALNSKANLLEELINISKVDINSHFFDMLLYRELLKSQDNFSVYRPSPYGKKEKKDYSKFVEYLKTVKKDDMYLIDLSLAYFSLYEKNMEDTNKYLSKLLKEYSYKTEVKTLAYVVYLNELKKVDEKTENELFEKMISFKDKSENFVSIHDYTFVKLVELYSKQKDGLKAFLSRNVKYLQSNAITLDIYNKIDAFINKKNKTKLELYMAKKFKKDSVKRDLDRVQVKLLVNNLKFQEALDTNNKFLNYYVEFNIFNGSIKGNNRVRTKHSSTLREILQKLVDIKNGLKKDPNLPIENYLYANALYNLSFFGNSEKLTTVYKSNYYFKNIDLQKQKIKLAIQHYKKALENSKKDEFKAKILYLLAKSELSLYDLNSAKKFSSSITNAYDFDRVWSWRKSKQKIYKEYVKNGYGEFFDKLNKEYSNTKYYKELIQECANLSYYNSLK